MHRALCTLHTKNTRKMTVYTEILGNTRLDHAWHDRIEALPDVEYIRLDQWMAQKSRFLGKGDKGGEYAVALRRQSQVRDGDVILYEPERGRAAVLRLDLNPVLVADLSRLAGEDPDTVIRHAVELGHAIGNQHWPAVVKGTKVYVPLTVDRKVMLSVLDTHHIEGITYTFEEGTEVIPYLAPHEVRRLFGGAGHESHSHTHADPDTLPDAAPHADGAIVEADGRRRVITHDHGDGHVHTHTLPDTLPHTAELPRDYDAEQYPHC